MGRVINKFVFFDVDDTLIRDENYPKNLENIKKQINILKKQGFMLGVCTFRTFDSTVKKIIKEYNLNGPIIVEGGACIFKKVGLFYKKTITYKRAFFNLNKVVKKQILEYNKTDNCNIPIKITTKLKNKTAIVINSSRKSSATIRFPKSMKNKIDSIICFLEKNSKFNNMVISKSNKDFLKINIFPKNVNKITTIERVVNSKETYFVTDFEETFLKPKENLKIYSVGTDKQFNKLCNDTFSEFGEGVEQILIKIRSKKMKEYEQISNNLKMLWKENFNLKNEKYTQVSGYIFNNKNEMLIVKNGKTWTVPGGHPEFGEKPIETLIREVMEEACVKIKEINYLGAVEVVENNETYYQLRYTAKVDEVLPFVQEWEINERKFVNLKDLNKYIAWSNGITFSKQINSAKEFWNF